MKPPKITVRCRLEPTPDAEARLRRQAEVWQAMVARALEVAVARNITGRKRLHEAVYGELRGRWPEAPSHYAYTAITKARAIWKSFRRRRRQGRTRKARPELDARRLRLYLDDAHLWTLEERDGAYFLRVAVEGARGRDRLEVRLAGTGWLRRRLGEGFRVKACELVWRDGGLWAHIVLEKPVCAVEVRGLLSVDVNARTVDAADWARGLYMVLVVGAWLAVRNRYLRTIAVIQRRVGGRKARRRLRAKYYGAMNARLRQLLHTCAAWIVRYAAAGGLAMALENLRYVKEANRIDVVTRGIFNRLQAYIAYKAALEGIPVVWVNPRGTSSRCPVCEQAKLKRDGASGAVSCGACGLRAHRQRVGAVGVGRRALQAKAGASPRAGSEPCPASGIGPMAGRLLHGEKAVLRLTEKGWVVEADPGGVVASQGLPTRPKSKPSTVRE
ncbi:hypothetical protein HRbin11_00892 [bacterium HR11]|nr:hypothetical protein HRbin11_00892 [bacterium HR11]